MEIYQEEYTIKDNGLQQICVGEMWLCLNEQYPNTHTILNVDNLKENNNG